MFLNMSKFSNIGFFDENFFLYLEEIDLCRRIKKINEKIYIDENIKIFHHGGKSVDQIFSHEIELTRNWHWMWSFFYYNKKHFGYFYSLIITLPKLFSSLFKMASLSEYYRSIPSLYFGDGYTSSIVTPLPEVSTQQSVKKKPK